MQTDASTPLGGSRRFQVLSLDGGGVLGIFTAAFLAQLEQDLGRPVVDSFDLIVGTSTGGIIAAGLGAGLSAAEILAAYVEGAATVFPGPRVVRQLIHPVRHKYSDAGREALLRQLLGDRTLGESLKPLVLPSFNLGSHNVYLFKTPHHERLRRDWRIPLWQAAMATSAAPTYFPAYDLPTDHSRLIDGGVWANNPCMVGVAEATSLFAMPLSAVRLLSIGTTSPHQRRRRNLDKGGLLQWVRSPNILETLMAGQSAGAFTQAIHLLGAERAHRVDVPTPAGKFRLDRATPESLIAAAGDTSRTFCPTYLDVFGDHVAEPFQPCHQKKEFA
jgi:patatin-like phospholipase/acyl hydrolase